MIYTVAAIRPRGKVSLKTLVFVLISVGIMVMPACEEFLMFNDELSFDGFCAISLYRFFFNSIVVYFVRKTRRTR